MIEDDDDKPEDGEVASYLPTRTLLLGSATHAVPVYREWEGLMDPHVLCKTCYELWSGRGGSAT